MEQDIRLAARELKATDSPRLRAAAPIHQLAHVDGEVKIGAGSTVSQFASVTRSAVVGEDCTIAASTLIDGPSSATGARSSPSLLSVRAPAWATTSLSARMGMCPISPRPRWMGKAYRTFVGHKIRRAS
jgi:hypothetical protein